MLLVSFKYTTRSEEGIYQVKAVTNVCYYPMNVLALYYDDKINRFINEMGVVMDDIHRHVTPAQIMLFKHKGEDMEFLDPTGKYVVELIYPDFSYYHDDLT